MDYGMIGKIEKAKRYAQERHRFHFEAFAVTVDGENNAHRVEFADNKWTCNSEVEFSPGVPPTVDSGSCSPFP